MSARSYYVDNDGVMHAVTDDADAAAYEPTGDAQGEPTADPENVEQRIAELEVEHTEQLGLRDDRIRELEIERDELNDALDEALAKLETARSAGEQADSDRAADGDTADGNEPEAEPVEYSAWTKAQLTAEVEKRNAERSDDEQIDVASPGNKPELVIALQLDDAEQAEKVQEA